MIHQYSSFIDGGAGRAALRLHQSLRSIGVTSQFIYSDRRNRGKSVSELDEHCQVETWQASIGDKWLHRMEYHANHARFKRAIANRPGGRDLFTSPRWSTATSIDPSSIATGDVIHLHWIAKFIDWTKFFASIPDETPIVWTLHDMNPMTGGCHFSGGCDSFTRHCGNCFQLAHPHANDISRRQLQVKRNALRGKNLHIVGPSRWMRDLAKQSSVFADAKSFHHVPLAIDASQYAPKDAAIARQRLGIAPEKFVLVFGAMGLDSVRKGAREFAAALTQLADRDDIHVVLFGNGELPLNDSPLPPITRAGLIRNRQTLCELYSAADAFVLPSLEDNLPLTGLEAFACAAPVIGFDAGGIPDYVQHGKTGLLAATGDVAGLVEQICWAAEHRDDMAAMGQAALRWFHDHHAAPTEARTYAALYESLVGESVGRRAA